MFQFKFSNLNWSMELKEIWSSYKDQLIPFIKGSLIAFDFYYNSNNVRMFPQGLSLNYIIENGNHVINISAIDNEDVKFCFPLFSIENDQLIFLIPNTDEIEYYCDVCESGINVDGLICEDCNYDLCSKCITNNHGHNMFQYKGYFRMNTFSIENLVESIEIEI